MPSLKLIRLFAGLTLALPFALAAGASAQTSPSGLTGLELAEKVAARPNGDQVSQKLTITMTDPSGAQTVRETIFVAKEIDGTSKSMIYIDAPAKLRGTAFMTFDYAGADKVDDQWLYLPSMGRSRRIAASDRGDSFLGTDFTFEDIKSQGKPLLDEFNFTYAGEETLEGVSLATIEGAPKSDSVRKELGYGKVLFSVHEPTSMVVKAEYWDANLNPLKTVRMYDLAPIQGIMTAQRLVAENKKTGHKTEFRFTEIDYGANIRDDIFSESGLRKGL